MTTPIYQLKYGPMAGGGVYGEIPFDSLTWTEVLNGPGSWTASMPLTANIHQSELEPGASCIWVLRDAVPVWSGPCWTASVDVDQDVVTLQGEGWLSYFDRRYLMEDVSWTQWDQASIIGSLIRDYGGLVDFPTNKRVPVSTAGINATGVLRDRTYLAKDRHQISGLITDLTKVVNGMGIRFTPVVSGARYVSKVEAIWPSTGTHCGEYFELGSNLSTLKVGIDASTRANNIEVIGAGEDEALIATASVVDTAPKLQRTTRVNDVTVPETLIEMVEGQLTTHRSPVATPQIGISLVNLVSAGMRAGDVITVRARRGYLDLNADYIITEMKVDLTPAEVVSLTLAPAGTFA